MKYLKFIYPLISAGILALPIIETAFASNSQQDIYNYATQEQTQNKNEKSGKKKKYTKKIVQKQLPLLPVQTIRLPKNNSIKSKLEQLYFLHNLVAESPAVPKSYIPLEKSKLTTQGSLNVQFMLGHPFYIGVDGKAHFPTGNELGGHLAYYGEKGMPKTADFGIFTGEKLIAGLDVAIMSNNQDYKNNSIDLKNMRTPIANGLETRVSSQEDITTGNLQSEGNRIAYSIEYNGKKNGNKGKYTFGFQHANTIAESKDTSNINSIFLENYADTTFEIQEGIPIFTRTQLNTELTTNIDVNSITKQIENYFRLYFDMKFGANKNKKIESDLILKNEAQNIGISTNVLIDQNVNGLTEVRVNNGQIDSFAINNQGQYNTSSDTSFNSKERRAFLKLGLENLIANGVRVDLTLPLKKGSGENIGFGARYLDPKGTLIGMYAASFLGENFDSKLILMGGNIDQREALVKYTTLINDLSRNINPTDQMSSIYQQEATWGLYGKLIGLAGEFEITKTPGQTTNLTTKLIYGNGKGSNIYGKFKTGPNDQREAEIGAKRGKFGTYYKIPSGKPGQVGAYYRMLLGKK